MLIMVIRIVMKHVTEVEIGVPSQHHNNKSVYPIISNPSKKHAYVRDQCCLPVAFPRPRFLLLEKEEVILDEQLQQRPGDFRWRCG